MFSLTCTVDNDTHYLLIKFFDLIAIYSRLYTKKKICDMKSPRYFKQLFHQTVCNSNVFL